MKDSITTNVTLSSVLHILLMITNLLSLYELRKKGVYFQSDDLTLQLVFTDKELSYDEETSNLFVLKTSDISGINSMTLISRVTSQSMFISQPIKMLHKRLAHFNIQDVKKLVSMTTDIKIKNDYMPDVCRGCVDEKHL